MAKQIVDDDAFDERGLLKDGRTVSFGMLMKDSLSDVQRAILETQQGSQRGGCNGYAFVDAAQSKAALQDAYDEYDAQQANAWHSPSNPVEAKPNARPMTRDEAYDEYDRQQENAWRLPNNRGDR